MSLNYMLKRLQFRISVDGLHQTFSDMFFVNRDIIIVEKDVSSAETPTTNQSFKYSLVNHSNSLEFEDQYNLPLFHHYACNNCTTLIATKNGDCCGFIRWTRDEEFWDLKKFDILLKPDEAYMFDFFLFPEFRGTNAVKEIPSTAIGHLCSAGVSKFYGFYFLDNLQALWWHRAFLHAKEINRLRAHKLLILDIVDGKVYL